MDDDSDIEPPTQHQHSQSQSQSMSQVGLSTQQDKTLADIFGDDSDDDNNNDDDGDNRAAAPVQSNYQNQRTKTVYYGEYDSLDDSDNESDHHHHHKKSSSHKILKKKGSSSSSSKAARDDSDDDVKQSSKKKLDKKKDKKRKHVEDAHSSKSGKGDKHSSDKKRSKRDKSSSRSPGKGGDAGDDGDASSADEYDSGEDAVRNRDDDAFLASDSDDDLRGVTREYDEDNQVFDDERPDKKSGAAKSKKSTSREGGSRESSGGGGSSSKADDPMSQTLAMIKKPKTSEMSEIEKTRIVTELLRKMDIACRADDELYRQKQPAIHKMNMLKTVQSIVEIKALHSTLLEYDILGAFRDWLEPKDDKTLPSLEVRTAIYHMLLSLPCQVDHLKRSTQGKQPIGITIVALRKHKMETETNKRLLKEIMEKWSRPVFSKSVDARNTSGRDSLELRELAAQRHRTAIAKAEAAASPRGGSPRTPSIDNAERDLMFGGASAGGAGAAGQTVAGFSRARASCPQSSGFLFTVQPEYKIAVQAGNDSGVAAGNVKAQSSGGGASGGGKSELGETREKLLKIMRDHKSVPRGGKKQNVKAIGVTLNGRNKA
jgi:transcription factor SPN1